MMMRKLAVLAALALGTAAALDVPTADARGYVSVRIGAPPPPRYERVIVRPGYVWSPGYWRWNGRRHVWIEGYWMRERPGYVWVGPRWNHMHHGGAFRGGYWARR